MHEGGEGVLVGFEVGRGVGREHVQDFAVGVQLAGILFGIGLDPLRYVVCLAVLPGSEPEQNEVEVVLTCTVYEQIHVGEVELALFGLHLLPVDGRFDGVDMKGVECRPYLWQSAGPRTGVIDLSTEDKEGFAFDDHGKVAVLFLQTRHVVGQGTCRECAEHSKKGCAERDSSQVLLQYSTSQHEFHTAASAHHTALLAHSMLK